MSGRRGPKPTLPNAEFASVVTVRDLVQADVSRNYLQSAEMRRVFHGVYAHQNLADTVRLRAEAAVRRAGEGTVLCEATGLQLLDIAIPYRLIADDRIHLLARADSAGPRFRGVAAHHCMSDNRYITVNGLPVLDPVECWLQIAQRAAVDELVVIADSLTRRQEPVLAREQLLAGIEAGKGRRGIRYARQAIGLSVARTDSPTETLTRLALVHSGLPCPEVNFPILDETGRPMYWLDMAYPQAMLAVEYDGRVHVGDHRQMEWDAARRRYLEDRGWRVITVTAADIKERFPGFIRSVATALRERTPG